MSETVKAPNLLREPGEAYRARRNQYTTSHQLADFRRCPLLHKQKQAGLIAESIGDYYALGAAAHCLILEGRQEFEQQYIVGGPINEKTGRPFGDETKAFRTWAELQTKRVISDEQYALCCHLNAAVHSHEEASRLLASGTPEGVLRATYCGVECQIRMDWFNDDAGIGDLKTTQDLDNFVAYTADGELSPQCDVRRYGYIGQMAFYRAILNIAAGLPPDAGHWPVTFIAVEKQPPYRCGVWAVDDRRLSAEEGLNAVNLYRLAGCRRTGIWPTGFEKVRIL